jgi:hypothetical protein
MLSGDWAYNVFSDDDEWKEKWFNRSRGELHHDTVLRDLLQEAHVTWDVSNFSLRLGKQIVVWGETDNFRLMDQINPLDQRRGLTDYEFESTIVPLWLAKAEYFMQPMSSWLQDLSFEFTFNPNADFVPDRGPLPGNELAGIWSADVPLPVPIVPGALTRLALINDDLDDPESWDSDYWEYGFRVKSVINDAFMTFNYFYGISNGPVMRNLAPADVEISEWDGSAILKPYREGYFPRFRLAGATLTRDFENFYISALGGVGPVLRVEAFYGFDNTFSTNLDLDKRPPSMMPDAFEKHDELRYAIGMDWKIKLPVLNPRAYFMLSGQFYHRHVFDYPSQYRLSEGQGGNLVEEDEHTTSLVVNTTYFHNKLEPTFIWVRWWTSKSSLYQPQLKYEYSNKWNFTLGAIFLDGQKYDATAGRGLHALKNKDHIFLTVAYRF